VAVAAELYHPIGPHTVADWLALPDTVDGSRVELIYGYLHVSPAPSTRHQRTVYRLTRALDDAVRASGSPEFEVLPSVNVEISTAWRTALIPDVVVLDQRTDAVSVPPDRVVLAVEVWSPANNRAERETKMAGYASAGVPFLWTVTLDTPAGPVLTTYRLADGRYVTVDTLSGGSPVAVSASPVPITVDVEALLSG
jgi:Uma2 family endonuclease